MVVRIGTIVVGALIFIAGLYYLIKEKNDPESKKIYSIVSVVGAIILIIGIVLLLNQ